MAERDRAAVRVHARIVVAQAELAQHRQALRGEGFVQFDEVHLVQRHASWRSSFCVAGAGPMPITRGATPAVAMPTMRARGVRPCCAPLRRWPAAARRRRRSRPKRCRR
jgi:hypothetical protein